MWTSSSNACMCILCRQAREAQRREREEREKAFKEKQKEHQASRARQKESAAAAAGAAFITLVVSQCFQSPRWCWMHAATTIVTPSHFHASQTHCHLGTCLPCILSKPKRHHKIKQKGRGIIYIRARRLPRGTKKIGGCLPRKVL